MADSEGFWIDASDPPTGRVVLLPRVLDAKLDELVHVRDMMNGVLFYNVQEGEFERYCPVSNIYMTGKNAPGSITPDHQRLEVVEELLRRHPDYRHIPFHTASQHALNAFPDWFEQYARELAERLVSEEGRDPEFMIMAVGIEGKVIYGDDNPGLRVVQNYPEVLAAQIDAEIGAIKAEKGFVFPRFKVRP